MKGVINKTRVICGVYRITAPDNRVYIGQSVNILSRWRDYKKNNKISDQPRVYESMVNFGYDNHKFDVLIECDKNDLIKFEKIFTTFFDSTDQINGLNINCGRDISEETKNKIAYANSHPTEETRRRKRLSNLGRKHSETARQNMSKSQIGNLNSKGKKCMIDDLTFNSIRKAAIFYNMPYTTLIAMANNTIKNKLNIKLL